MADIQDNLYERYLAWLSRLFHIDYHSYLRSEVWHRKAAACKRRARYRCQLCGRAKRLEAHHRTYKRLGFETKMDIIALCHDCHDGYHKKIKNKW